MKNSELARVGGGALALMLVLTAGGCKAVGPSYERPTIATPEAWASELGVGLTARSMALEPGQQARWWTLLNDPVLTGLVDRAVAGNLDLKQASARVREARALRGVAGSGGRPTVDVGADYSRSAQSETSSRFSQGDGAGRDLFQGGFDSSWELDVFGGTRRNIEAADADVGAAQWARRDVLVTLIAETGRQYVELRTAQQRLVIARQNVDSQRQTLGLTENRLRAGLTSELDVTRARSQLATTQATIPLLEGQSAQAIYGLSVLCGQFPGALAAELSAPAQIPMAVATGSSGIVSGVASVALPTGVPMDLVRRRPDVRQAERELAAATARIGVATSELYPSFSLRGSIGLASSQIGTLLEGNSRYWSIGPGVRWNILDFGRIRSSIDVQEARTAFALAGYEGGVLRALREVDSAIVGFTTGSARRVALSEAVSAQLRAVELSTRLYREGLADFISVLDTQRQLLILQDQEAEAQGGVTLSLVQLYKSLGGGWEVELTAEQAGGGAESAQRGTMAADGVVEEIKTPTSSTIDAFVR